MEIKMPGEELVAKLWETVAEKGIGNLFKPWQMRREARAALDNRCQEIERIAQAERNAELIKQGELSLAELNSTLRSQSHGNYSISRKRPVRMEPNFFDPDELSAKAKEVAIADVIRREVNVTNALLIAEAELENDSQTPPDEKIDNDWLFRWRDCASQVSSEELQKIWGKLIAGEVKSPGTYSLRTLEFLKNLSQAEAVAIAKLSRFVLDGKVIFSQTREIFESEGVNLDFLLNMQELGLIAGVELSDGLSWRITSGNSKFSRPLLSNGMVLWVRKDSAEDLIISGYVITILGRQVLQLGKFEPHLEYLKEVGRHIKNRGFDVLLGELTAEKESFNGGIEILYKPLERL
jgi:hypothetical protein